MIADLVRIYREIQPDLVKHVAIKPIVYGTVAAWFSRPRAVVNYMAGLGWLFTSDSIKARLRDQEADVRALDVERRDGAIRAGFRVRARSPVFADLIDTLLRDPHVRRATLE